jgi:hypothetical protein
MSDDKTQINANERPELTTPEVLDQQAQSSQASAAAQRNQRPEPGRRPLLHLKDRADDGIGLRSPQARK